MPTKREKRRERRRRREERERGGERDKENLSLFVIPNVSKKYLR
jgi:hypothetical protein